MRKSQINILSNDWAELFTLWPFTCSQPPSKRNDAHVQNSVYLSESQMPLLCMAVKSWLLYFVRKKIIKFRVVLCFQLYSSHRHFLWHGHIFCFTLTKTYWGRSINRSTILKRNVLKQWCLCVCCFTLELLPVTTIIPLCQGQVRTDKKKMNWNPLCLSLTICLLWLDEQEKIEFKMKF